MSKKENVTIIDALQTYVRVASVKSNHTKKTYRTALETHFLTFLESINLNKDAPVSNLSLDYITEFIAWLSHDYRSEEGLPLKDSSRVLYTTAVNGFFRHLIARGLLPGILMSDYDILKILIKKQIKHTRSPIKKRLPKKEFVDAIISAAQKPPDIDEKISEKRKRRKILIWRRNLAMILALHSSGMRVGELVSLQRNDLDYTDQGVYVIGKGKRERYVRFSTKAWQAMTDYLDARKDGQLATSMASHPIFCRHDRRAGNARLPLTTHSVRRIFTELATQAGIFKKFQLTPHTLRHYFATTLLRETGDLALTQDALGHADPGTTRIYADPGKKGLISAHRKIFG